MQETIVKRINGFDVLVDSEGALLIDQFACRVQLRGKANPYLRIRIPRVNGNKAKEFLLHRVLLDAPDYRQVDHINGNTLDNRKCNLRLATSSENVRNNGPKNGKQYKGTQSHETRFQAIISNGGKQTYLGTFDTEALAAMAYDKAAIKEFGEFAFTNFPREIVNLVSDSELNLLRGKRRKSR